MTEKKQHFDNNSEEVAMLLLNVARKSFRQIVEAKNLRPPQAMFLVDLLHRGPVSMSEMAAEVKIHPTVATHFMNRMVKKGFVERQSDESDRRIVRVDLTAEGRKMAEILYESYMSRVDEALKGVNSEGKQSFLSTLTRIDEALNE